MTEYRAELTAHVTNRYGIHVRPSQMIVAAARQYPHEILLENKGTVVNAKSIIPILSLQVERGEDVTVRVVAATCAKDAERVAEEIKKLIEGFDYT